MMVVLDEDDRVVAASRRAREAVEGLVEGEPLPQAIADGTAAGIRPVAIPYELGGRRSRGCSRCSRRRSSPARTWPDSSSRRARRWRSSGS